MSIEPMLLVTIGLDFGSSFTKVCYRVQGDRIDKSGIVELGDGVGENKYFLESKVHISKDKNYLCLNPFNDCIAIKFIKPALIKSSSDPQKDKFIKEINAFFIANVLSISVSFIENNESKILSGRYIEWMLNVGIPVDKDEPLLEKRYKEIVNVATNLFHYVSANSLMERLNWVKEYWNNTLSPASDFDVFLTPELLAEVIDVFEDPEVGDGLSIIVDVGGATLDVAFVNLDTEFSEVRYLVDFIAAKVSLLGVESVMGYLGKSIGVDSEINTKVALLEKRYYYLLYNEMKKKKIRIDGLNGYGKTLQDKFRGFLADICLTVKNTSMNYKLSATKSIPLYLLGGGKDYYWYKYWPIKTYNDTLKKCNIPKFSPVQLRSHPKFGNIENISFERFRVASGLLNLETMLELSGLPWFFKPIEKNYNKGDYHYELARRQKEIYGDK